MLAAVVMCLELFIAGSANHGPWGSNAIHLLVVFVCVGWGGDLSSPTEKAVAPHSSSLPLSMENPMDRGAWKATYSPWGCEESDTTKRLHFHFSLSCIGEGNSNPLQCSCLENPKDGEAWWAAVCGVAQSRTRLK